MLVDGGIEFRLTDFFKVFKMAAGNFVKDPNADSLYQVFGKLRSKFLRQYVNEQAKRKKTRPSA